MKLGGWRMRKTLNISKDVIDHLQKQDNMSAYVSRLIRQDKEGIDAHIIQLIQEYVVGVSPPSTSHLQSSISSILNL